MRIGLTYDLRSDYLAAGFSEEETAEFDRERTIEGLEDALRSLGHRTERIGRLASLVEHVALKAMPGWDLVFNIAEGMYGLGREAQIPALLDAYKQPYTFSDPMVLTLTLHKGMTKRVVRDMGLPTPAFAVVDCVEQIKGVKLPYPLFAKPVAEGTSKGISARSRISTAGELGDVCEQLLAQYEQPVIIETYLPGREVTVGIVGTGERARAVGTMEVILQPGADDAVYTYRNKENSEELVRYAVPEASMCEEAEGLALAVWRGMGCRDGGRVDLRADDAGRLQFLEVNPLPGLHPEHSDLPILCSLLGIPYQTLIGWIVASAMERVGSPVLSSR